MTTQQPLDINEYRKQRGTKGNFSIMLLTCVNDDINLDGEGIGVYEDPKDLATLLSKTIMEMTPDEIKVTEVAKYSMYLVDNVFTFKIVFSIPNEGNVAAIFRVYFRSSSEYVALHDLVESTFQKFGISQK